jgi:hypothetical protein
MKIDHIFKVFCGSNMGHKEIVSVLTINAPPLIVSFMAIIDIAKNSTSSAPSK